MRTPQQGIHGRYWNLQFGRRDAGFTFNENDFLCYLTNYNISQRRLVSGLYSNIVWICIIKEKSVFSIKSWKLLNYNDTTWNIHLLFLLSDKYIWIKTEVVVSLFCIVKHQMWFRHCWILCSFRPLPCRSGWRFFIQQGNDWTHCQENSHTF